MSPNDIILEDRSRDTFENARFTNQICVEMGYKNPILVTSGYHLKRSIMSFERFGTKVTPFPADFKCREKGKHRWNEYLPGNFSNFRTISIAMCL